MSGTAVVFGGPSPEHDISVLTGLQASRILFDAGCDVAAIYWAITGRWYRVEPTHEASEFADGPPPSARELRFVAEPGAGWMSRKKSLGIDVALLCCHGAPGEDGTLQGALDLVGVRYSGPDAAASSLGMDKLAFGTVVADAGLPSLPRSLVVPGQDPEFDAPYIVKPRFGGSSIGIEIVDDYETALALVRSSPHMGRGGVVEPYLEGSRDLNMAIRTYPEPQLSAIEAPVSPGFYGYKEKYLSGGGLEGSERSLPADLSDDLESTMRGAARRVAGLAGVRSMARLDFLERDGEVWINEINTIPGSLSLYLWVDPPISKRQLVLDLVAEIESFEARSFPTAGADGFALKSAAAIAHKLG